ncbi:type II toxin-antitoxin system Phd/YefM family antitoxin [Arthrobacter sp. TB 26]|uniref:type II toxin-antitoxin system Phd/YefM family antitoxin n=1 Tax=Arthrobacter sp. TB 26 TaxID=494420 RepID=UPI000462BF0A|nr:type II toxin-antitoxin system Phd/YefM family antitoxin [Arthrobacter sp. TB 26]
MTIAAIETVTQARSGLTGHLKAFRREGVLAEPALIGGHRKPEAALIPIEMYEQLLPQIDEIRMRAEAAHRIATQTSMPLADLVSELGLGPEA